MAWLEYFGLPADYVGGVQDLSLAFHCWPLTKCWAENKQTEVECLCVYADTHVYILCQITVKGFAPKCERTILCVFFSCLCYFIRTLSLISIHCDQYTCNGSFFFLTWPLQMQPFKAVPMISADSLRADRLLEIRKLDNWSLCGHPMQAEFVRGQQWASAFTLLM